MGERGGHGWGIARDRRTGRGGIRCSKGNRKWGKLPVCNEEDKLTSVSVDSCLAAQHCLWHRPPPKASFPILRPC